MSEGRQGRGKSSGEIGEADWDGERGFERGKEVSRGKGGLEGKGLDKSTFKLLPFSLPPFSVTTRSLQQMGQRMILLNIYIGGTPQI